MANGNDPTYRRIPYLVRVRLKRLGSLCAHGCAAVAHAAHAEIGRIHRKYRLSRPARVRAWLGGVAKAGVRKVTPKQLHGPLRVKAGAPQQAPQRGQATPIRAKLPAEGARAPHGPGQTMADVRQRARDEKAARKQQRRERSRWRRSSPQPAGRQNGDGMDGLRGQWQGYHASAYGGQEGRKQRVPTERQPRRQPDAMQQATENMRRQHAQPQGARSPGRPGQTAPFTEHTAQPQSRNGQQPRTDHHGPVRDLYSPDSVLSADDRQARAAARREAQQSRNGQDAERSRREPPPLTESMRRRAEGSGQQLTRAARIAAEDAPGPSLRMPQGMNPEIPARAKLPPLPGDPEARLQPGEKRRWARLPKRGADAPERTRSSRSRTRTTA